MRYKLNRKTLLSKLRTQHQIAIEHDARLKAKYEADRREALDQFKIRVRDVLNWDVDAMDREQLPQKPYIKWPKFAAKDFDDLIRRMELDQRLTVTVTAGTLLDNLLTWKPDALPERAVACVM